MKNAIFVMLNLERMKQLIVACLSLLLVFSASAQTTFPVNGVQENKIGLYAFTNATVHIDHEITLEKATILIKGERIIGVGASLAVPKNAILYNLKGYHVYPGLIDIYSDYGVPEVKKPKNDDDGPQFVSNKKGAYGWNQAIKPEINAVEHFVIDKKATEKLRALGFSAVLTHQQDGVARGTGVLINLTESNEQEAIIKSKASAHYSFSKGTSTQDYPGSLMGVIALIKQTYLDAEWYAKNKEDINLSLEAWNNCQELPSFMEVADVLSILRADLLGDEFGKQYIMIGNGDEYKKAEAIKATNASFVLPLEFPKPYDVEDPFDAQLVSLADMKHWEMAPANAALLKKQGVTFAFSLHGLKDTKSFWSNLHKTVEHGLTKGDALRALTSSPAKMVNAQKDLGTISKGKFANLLITSGDLFEKGTEILQNWVQGEQHVVKTHDFTDLRGTYELKFGDQSYNLHLEGSLLKNKAKIMVDDSTNYDVTYSRKNELISLQFYAGDEGLIRLSGERTGNTWTGKGTVNDGSWTEWSATLKNAHKEEEKEEKEAAEKPEIGAIIYPFLAYGYTERPKVETILFKNATVWTNEADGILENTDVLIKNGKIAAIGKNIPANDAKIIDAKGKHLTAGIIDEHSHIAISRGVNEWTQASSAEVSIADVVNSDDVNIYRQLAGGVTAAQLLHGSANPIGGRSALIKFRWGFTPEEMKIKGADGFIKFALGENVKQSNWGDRNTVRYPQTRMGVEQVFVDYFTQALEYQEAWKTYNGLSKKEKASATPPRENKELEYVLEIINKERFITCHSYVQSEITMLMRVAEQFGFRINTFTHILEGYKVADKMKEHGAAGSTFADWWAYKYEVIDAIPYNAALLHEQGVVTGINSDDAEMGRRLNQEAAKSVKYGGMSEEEAWKMVTLNPAKMLHLDDRMGSVKVGKDADIVLWSDNPLSIYSQAEITFVDGVRHFDREKDAERRKEILAERTRLIGKMVAAKNGGAPTQKPKKKEQKLWHCDDLEGLEIEY